MFICEFYYSNLVCLVLNYRLKLLVFDIENLELKIFNFYLVYICVYNVSYVLCFIKYYRYVESERYNF